MAEFITISDVEAGTRLLRWFLRHYPGMLQRDFYKLCRGGQIRINSSRCKGMEVLKAGDVVISGEREEIKPGNAMPLKNMPIGTIVHNVELKPGAGGQLARSAGCYAQLMGKDGVYAQIKMNSGELRKVHSDCFATVGSVSNPDQRNVNLGKAGRARWLGVRPSVRGMAMNPNDHPMGGGNGHSKGHEPVSRTGIPAKGYRTRSNKRTAKMIIRSRHLAKKK